MSQQLMEALSHAFKCHSAFFIRGNGPYRVVVSMERLAG